MARIDDRILRSVVYLYPSVDAAEAGEESGATGFRVSVPSEDHPHRSHIYAVTNDHVIQGGSSIIRTSDPYYPPHREIIPLGINQWRPHPKGDDVAIAPLGSVNNPEFPNSIPSFMLLTHEVILTFDIGPGDDVYMVGRFVYHAGKYFNQPSVRSGIISVMPSDIEVDNGTQEAFLIEMRSISGHSGSPVTWNLPLFHPQARIRNLSFDNKNLVDGPWLLGIDCGAFSYYDRVFKKVRGRRQKTDLEAKSHAGQAVVIPAWKLGELLNLEEFVKARKEEDRRLTEKQRTSRSGA